VHYGSSPWNITIGTVQSYRSYSQACAKVLNYAAIHPDATFRYTKSATVLRIHSDASYLSENKAQCRAGGSFYLGSYNTDESSPDAPPSAQNRAIHINNVMASATEAEVGTLFHNAQDGCAFRQCLEFFRSPKTCHPHPNQQCLCTVEAIINDTVKQKRSKTIDMQLHLVRHQVRQGRFHIY